MVIQWFIEGWARANWLAVGTVFPAWIDHPGQRSKLGFCLWNYVALVLKTLIRHQEYWTFYSRVCAAVYQLLLQLSAYKQCNSAFYWSICVICTPYSFLRILKYFTTYLPVKTYSYPRTVTIPWVIARHLLVHLSSLSKGGGRQLKFYNCQWTGDLQTPRTTLDNFLVSMFTFFRFIL